MVEGMSSKAEDLLLDLFFSSYSDDELKLLKEAFIGDERAMLYVNAIIKAKREKNREIKDKYEKNFLQLAFNSSTVHMTSIIPKIPRDPRIVIEVGTPLIKREGMQAVKAARLLWPYRILADLKTLDGAYEEVLAARNAGADIVTVAGSAPLATLNAFVSACRELGVKAMVDMLGVKDPLKIVFKMKDKPDYVVIHRGRDEENVWGTLIQYKEIAKLKGKYDISVGAAGGMDLREVERAIFNGADFVIVNIVRSEDPWKGLLDRDVNKENIERILRMLF